MDEKGIIHLFREEQIVIIPDNRSVISIHEDSTVNQTQSIEIIDEKEIEAEVKIKEEASEVSVPRKSDFAVIVDYIDDIPATEKELLTKILASINIDIKDIQLVNMHGKTVDEVKIAHKIIAFGQTVHDFFKSDRPFYAYFKEDDYEVLFADSLNLLESNRDLKIKLWQALKG